MPILFSGPPPDEGDQADKLAPEPEGQGEKE